MRSILVTAFLVAIVGSLGCTENTTVNDVPTTPIDEPEEPSLVGYWILEYRQVCGSTGYGSDSHSKDAAEIRARNGASDSFILGRLAHQGSGSFSGQSITTDTSSGVHYIEWEPKLALFPLRVTDNGNRFKASGEWVIPNIDLPCKVSIEAVRYEGPQVCEVMTPEETASLTSAVNDAISQDTELNALHAFWQENQTLFAAATPLSDGHYEWNGATWGAVNGATELILEHPSGWYLRYGDDNPYGWGDFTSSLTGASIPDWSARYQEPRGLDDTWTHYQYGSWDYSYSRCDTVCQNYVAISAKTPFGTFLRQGDGYDTDTNILEITLELAGATFSLAPAYALGETTYQVTYANRTTELTTEDIRAQCPQFLQQKAALFPDVGALLIQGFPF